MSSTAASSTPSTIVRIAEIEVVIMGDVAHNAVQPWLAQTNHDQRIKWIASVGEVEPLRQGSWWPDTSMRMPATTGSGETRA
jgi:hypothetical protein